MWILQQQTGEGPVEFSEDTRMMLADTESMRTRLLDALLIKQRLVTAIDLKKAQITEGNAEADPADLKRTLAKLKSCLVFVKHHLDVLKAYNQIEELAFECRNRGISPKERIVEGGRTLANALDDLKTFKRRSDPLQQLDCLYD